MHKHEKDAAIDKLFVYGTLMDAHNRQLVTGQRLTAETAVLYDYRRISPKGGYPFALPWRGSKIEGQVVHGITPAAWKKIDDYEDEGTLYLRKIVSVQIGGQFVEAYVYIGIPDALRPYLKEGIGAQERIQEFIEHSIQKYLQDKPDRCEIEHRKALSIQVTQELLSEEVYALVRQYFQDASLPPFIIKHELEKASLPSLDWLRLEPKAWPYAGHYLTLVVKFMIFNQLEERFRREFRARVTVSDAYYMHTISALMALKLLVAHYQHLQVAMSELGVDKYEPTFTFIDYVIAAIFIAEDLYTPARARNVADWVKTNQQPGILPLGAELEFSNVGFRAVTSHEGDDPKFDNFYYFYDFDLMRRGWKLGAHVDDHGFLTTTHTRTRGFLELAFGRYRLLGDVSKPATNDPWILAQIIDLAVRYVGIKPHSLHLSLQTAPNAPFRKLANPEYLLCLLLLGGDLREDETGQLREMRIHRGEILRIGKETDVYFSRLNRHHQNPEDPAWNFVVEYQFPRLSFDRDNQVLIMALKGLQLEANPAPLKDYRDCPYPEFQQTLQTLLLQWAAAPTPLAQTTLTDFLNVVAKGFAQEAVIVGPNYARYTQRILEQIEAQLQRRNKVIRNYDAHR